MNTSNPPTYARIRALLDLPAEARADDVYECVMGCLTEGLDCQFVCPARMPGKVPLYEAAWLSPAGTRYEGRGRSGREAALAAAVRLISEADEAALLRAYSEPELKWIESPASRSNGKKARRHGTPRLARSRRAGWPE